MSEAFLELMALRDKEQREIAINRFIAWLANNHIVVPDLTIGQDKVTGLSVYTPQDLPPDFQVIRVPSHLVITPQTCRDSIFQFFSVKRLKSLHYLHLPPDHQSQFNQKLTEGSKFISPKNWVIFYLFLNQILLDAINLDDVPSLTSDFSKDKRGIEAFGISTRPSEEDRKDAKEDVLVKGKKDSKKRKSDDPKSSKAKTSASSQSSEQVEDFDSDFSSLFRITLFQHSPYIQILPSEFSTPLHYTQNEVSLLKGTPLHHATLEREKKSQSDFKRIGNWFYKVLKSITEEQNRLGWNQREGYKRDKISVDCPKLSKRETKVMEDLNSFAISRWMDYAESTWGTHVWLDWDDAVYSLERRYFNVWKKAETSYGSRAFPPSLIGTKEEPEEEKPNQTEFNSMVGPILIPGLDTFNHQRGRKVTWSFEHSSSAPAEDPETRAPSSTSASTLDAVNSSGGSIVLTLHDPTPSESQVFNNYGAKSNEELLGSYGFVNSNHDDDSLTLVLGDSSSPSEKNEKWGQKHYWRFNQEEAPESLLAEIRERLLSVPKDPEEEEEKEDPEVEELKLKGEVLETLEVLLLGKRKTLKATEVANQQLIEKVRTAEIQNQGKPSKLHQFDEEKRQDKEPIREEVVKMISVYREGQRLILDKAIDWARKEMESIENKLEELEE